jgi:uncharacterized membrane protein YcaP (DUF421 family)
VDILVHVSVSDLQRNADLYSSELQEQFDEFAPGDRLRCDPRHHGRLHREPRNYRQPPFAPALAATAALIAMHWLFSYVAYHWHAFGVAVKGQPRTLIRDGGPDQRAMRRADITEHDLHEDLRAEGLEGLDNVKEARLERSGKLSVVKRSEPKVVEVKVEQGVQIVRLEIE